MKICDIELCDVMEFLRLEDDGSSEKELTAMMKVAETYIKDYTGLTDDEVNEKESFYIAYMVLVQDMYDNRSYYDNTSNVNKVVENILNLHRVNLI